MARSFHSYQVELLQEPFTLPQGIAPETAVVRFLNRNGKLTHTERYACFPADFHYQRILETEELILDNCYVKDFSLIHFREKFGWEKLTVIRFKNFSAINTFFESESATDLSYAEFGGISVDFINSVFAAGNVEFYKCRFLDIDVDFSRVNFGNENVNFQFTEFGQGDISFENSIFGEGDISFVNTHFGDGKVNFKGVHFGTGDVDFHFARFRKGDITFEKSVFGGSKVDFRKVEFGEGKLDFSRVDFGDGELNFEESEAGKGRKNFKRCKFGKAHVSFEMAQFPEILNFERSEFEHGKLSFFKSDLKGIRLSGAELGCYLDLRVEKCPVIDLSNCIIKDMVDLKPGFSSVDIKELNISGARNLGRIFIDWKLNRVKDLILSQKDTNSLEKAEQFRLLKEDFNANGQYEDEDSAYVQFKRQELRHFREIKTSGKEKVWYGWPAYFFQKIVYDKMGLYATSPVRVLASMFIIYFCFSMIYMLLPMVMDTEIQTGLSDPEPMGTMATSMYFSAITFFTIGYGDYFPYGIIRWVASMEGFTGVFMMSYFVVAFVRKMLR